MTDLFKQCCPTCGRAYEEEVTAPGFSAFWQMVPNKVGRAAAEKAWKKLTSGDRVLASERVKVFYEWFRKEYPTASLLHPATYLNGKRWEDVENTSTSNQPSQSDVEAIRRGAKSSVPVVREAAIKAAEKFGITL